MHLFILAAGTGSRLYPLTKDTPKSLLDMGNGVCLLEEQLRAATTTGAISRVTVITGYRSEQIEEWLERKRFAMPVNIVYNPFFATTNNLVSLWCARQAMAAGDFIVSNGDNLYQKGSLATALAGSRPEGITITVSRKSSYDDDDMKVRLAADGRVERIGKTLPAASADAESVGLAFVRGAAARAAFISTIERLLHDQEYLGRFWLETFNALIDAGSDVHVTPIPADQWAEVDFHPDVETVRAKIAQELEKRFAPHVEPLAVNE